MNLGILILGLAAGILSALLGIGGGVILVPGMIYLLGLDIYKAAGTSLAIILPTALMGVYRHNLNGNVSWKVALLIAIGSIIGAYLGTCLSKMIPPEILKKIFVFFLLATAYKMWQS